MTRRRSMQALLGTLALIAGCSTTHRSEITGVVRDRATGRAIPGARVVGADGALARTDSQGRFTLFVRPGSSAGVRVSAEGHASEQVELDGAEASVELAATFIDGDSFVIQTDDLSVLGWVEESWGDAGAADAGDDETTHVSTWIAEPHGDARAPASCVGCHADLPTDGSAHAGLADSCLACHAAPLGRTASTSCSRCHGASGPELRAALREEVSALAGRAAAALDQAILDRADRAPVTSCGGVATHFLQVGGAFRLVGADEAIVGDCDGDGVEGASERWPTVADVYPELGELEALLRDRSGGAHAPDRARELAPQLAH